MNMLAPNAVSDSHHGIGPQSQLARDLDRLVERLNAVEPEHGMPPPATIMDAVPVKTGPSRIWERLKEVARHLTPPPPTDEGVRTGLPAPLVSRDEHDTPDTPPPSLPASGQRWPTPSAQGAAVNMTKEASRRRAPTALFINGERIRQKNGRYSLNDLFAVSWVDAWYHPRRFLLKKTTQALVNTITEQHAGKRCLHVGKISGRGRGGLVWDVWGVKEVLLAYAAWLGADCLAAVRAALDSTEATPDASPSRREPVHTGRRAPEDAPQGLLKSEHPPSDENMPVRADDVLSASSNLPDHAPFPSKNAEDGIRMSSLEIAELTGKAHRNVMRDIRVMLTELKGEEGMPKFEHTHINPQNKQSYPVFRLPKDLTLTLVSGYNVKLRKRIIDRWLELERQAGIGAFAVPQTLQEALRLAADLLDQNQALLMENRILKQNICLPPPPSAGQAGRGSTSIATALSISELAKRFGLGRNFMCDVLRDEGLLLRNGTSHTPDNQALQTGLFAFRAHASTKRTDSAPHMQLVVTERGQAHIEQRLLARGLLNKARQHIASSEPVGQFQTLQGGRKTLPP